MNKFPMKDKRREYLAGLFSAAGIASAEADADALCRTFANMRQTIENDSYTLTAKSGCSKSAAELLRLTCALNSRRVTDKYKCGKKYTDSDMREYAKAFYYGAPYECISCILFDRAGGFISAEYVSDGLVSSATFLPRKLIDVATRMGAVSVTLMHNHPLGTPDPSEADIKATVQVISVLSTVGLTLRAHYVVAGFEVNDCMDYLGAVLPNENKE